MDKENENKKKQPPPSLELEEEEDPQTVKKVTLKEAPDVLPIPGRDQNDSDIDSDDDGEGSVLPGAGKLALTKSTIDVLQPSASEAAALLELQTSADLGGNDGSPQDVMDSDGRNLIINYLPPSFNEQDVMHYFSPYGIIENCKVVMDLASGKSKGYGFVKYSDKESAKKALQALNGYPVKNKHLKVAFARKNCKEIRNSNLYVTHLPKTLTDEGLRDLFKPYGNLIECRVLKDKQKKCRGVGFVRFDSHQNAMKARDALNKKTPPGWTREIRMKLASKRTDYATNQPPWPMTPHGAPMPPFGYPQPPYGYGYPWPPMPPPIPGQGGSPRRRGGRGGNGEDRDKGKRGDSESSSPRYSPRRSPRRGGVPYGGAPPMYPHPHYPYPYYYPQPPPASMSPWGAPGQFWGPPKGRGERDGSYYQYPWGSRSSKRRGPGSSYFLEHSNEEGERGDGPDRNNGYGYPFYSHFGHGYASPRSRPFTPRGNRGGENRTVIVSNISEDTTQEDLMEAFGRFNISNAKVVTKPRAGRGTNPPKPHAFLNFREQTDAQGALELNNSKIRGRTIKVNLKTTKPGGGYRQTG